MSFLSTLGNWSLLVIVFVVMISVLVAAHEYGHYLFARIFGMGVEEFAIGFGKKPLWIWMRRKYEARDEADPTSEPRIETTNFTVRPWPLGGFVKIKGMVPEDDGSEVHIPGGFYNKAPWKRLIVLLAGPAFSVVAGIVLLIPLYMAVGIEKSANKPVIGVLNENGAGYKSGLRPNDRIVSIDGKPVSTFYDLLVAVRESNAKPLQFTIMRDKKVENLTVKPEWTDDDAMVLSEDLEPTGAFRRQPMLGVGMTEDTIFVRVGFGRAFSAAVEQPVRAVRSLLGLVARPKNFGKSVSGPATMVALTHYAIERGLTTIIQLAALLSISVGIFNLLPFAPLDGGQMLVAFIELFRGGRRLSIQVQSAINGVGITLICVLVLGAWFFDFKRWFAPSDNPQAKAVSTKSR
jgi:regulator of sigma E protease